MNHKASIYSNPVIPAGLYYCQLLDLHTDTSEHPYLWASLQTGPAYGVYSGTTLSSILYRTPKAQALIAKFKATFRIGDEDALETQPEAIGRWGCVSVFLRQYQAAEFSCVSFVRQNPLMQLTSRSFEKQEQMGEKAWLDKMQENY